MDEVKALLNAGEEVTLSNGKKITFKDLPFFAVVALGNELAEELKNEKWFKLLQAEEESNATAILKALSDPKSSEFIIKVFSVSSSEDASVFEQLTTKDLLTCAIALKSAVDFEEIKKLFFELVPQNLLQNPEEK